MLASGTALQLAPRNLLVMLREAAFCWGLRPPANLECTPECNGKDDGGRYHSPNRHAGGDGCRGGPSSSISDANGNFNTPERSKFLDGLADVDSRSKTLFAKDFVDLFAFTAIGDPDRSR